MAHYDYFYPEKGKECKICGISAIAHKHKEGTLPKDFEVIEGKPEKKKHMGFNWPIQDLVFLSFSNEETLSTKHLTIAIELRLSDIADKVNEIIERVNLLTDNRK